MRYQTVTPRQRRQLAFGVVLGAICVVASVAVVAQPPGAGRPGGGGPPGGGPRGGGFRGGRGMFNAPNMAAAITPVPALAAELNLTDKQQQQIKQIQDQFRKDIAAMMPARGGGGPGGPGGPPPGGPNAGGPGGRMSGPPMDMKKMQDIATKASHNVEGVLTPAQKKAYPGALKEIGAMRQANIPLETLGQLKLTSSQRTKISGIAEKSQKEMADKMKAANGDFQSLMPAMQQSREKSHTDVMAVLSQPQKDIITKYEKDHPRGRFGGGGRRGGGGGNGGRPGAPTGGPSA